MTDIIGGIGQDRLAEILSFKLGDYVNVLDSADGPKRLRVRVTAITTTLNGGTEYRISYWHDGSLRQEWLSNEELSIIDEDPM